LVGDYVLSYNTLRMLVYLGIGKTVFWISTFVQGCKNSLFFQF